jgi:YD repeat-containing protein
MYNTDYDAAGRADLRDLGKSGSNPLIRVDYTYYGWNVANGQGRLQQVTSGIWNNLTSLQDLRYTYDQNGNVLTIQDYKVGSPQTQTFTYDALDRLTSGVASGGTGGTYPIQNYSYNSTTGNLDIKGSVNYTYGDANHDHAVTNLSTGEIYFYDANGNQITRNIPGGSYTLAYDAENRLVSVAGTNTTTYTYDGDGNRVKSSGSYMNLAVGKVPTSDASLTNAQVATDNDPFPDNSSQYAKTTTNGLHYVKIDLGATYSLNKIVVWHNANGNRTYHNTKTQVSVNGSTWVTVYDSAVSGEYLETPQGKEITFTTQNVRYIRDYVNGNTVDAYDHWTEIEAWGYGTTTYIGSYFEWSGSTSTMVKYYYAGSTRVAMRRGSSFLYWLLGDHLGSQAITADANGGKISEVRYTPWGEDRYYAYTSSTTFRFTGQRTENYINLY